MKWRTEGKIRGVLLEAREVDVSLCDGDAPENDVDHGADEDRPMAIRRGDGQTMNKTKTKAGGTRTRPWRS